MYERFTDRARKVMALAEQEAQRSICEYIGTIHILLGLIQNGGDIIVHALKNLGIEIDKIRTEIEKNMYKDGGTTPIGKISQSPGAKCAIRHAILEAENFSAPYVGVEHLLLGLLREKEGVASQILRNCGVGLDDVRNEILLLVNLDVRPIAASSSQLMQNTTAPPVEEPIPRRWTREEVYRMAELGLFFAQRTELIEGEIMVFAQQKPEYYTTLDRVGEMLRHVFEDSCFWVCTRMPLTLSFISEPEPDVSVVPGRREDYSDHPTTAVLIVEVSESSLSYDRTRKASLYARAGIADYWIVNLVNNQLEVYRDPRPDPSQHYGHGYASMTTLVPPAVVNPLAAPQVSLAVADLLR